MILQLHKGEAPQAVKNQLIRLLGEVPYGDVVRAMTLLQRAGVPSVGLMTKPGPQTRL